MGSWEAVGKVGLEAETQIKFRVPTLQEIYIHLFIRSFSHSTAANHCLTVPGTVLGAFINSFHSHRKQVQSSHPAYSSSRGEHSSNPTSDSRRAFSTPSCYHLAGSS